MRNTGYITQTAFASDMGWRPGQWPKIMQFAGVNFFYNRKEVDGEGDLQAVVYRNIAAQREVVVYND